MCVTEEIALQLGFDISEVSQQVVTLADGIEYELLFRYFGAGKALFSGIRHGCGDGVVLDLTNVIWILDLARIEFRSALYRRYRTGELNDEMLRIALNGFEMRI